MKYINSAKSGQFLQEKLFELAIGAIVLAASVHGVVSLNSLPLPI